MNCGVDGNIGAALFFKLAKRALTRVLTLELPPRRGAARAALFVRPVALQGNTEASVEKSVLYHLQAAAILVMTRTSLMLPP